MQLCTTTRNVGPVSNVETGLCRTRDACAEILSQPVISARPPVGMKGSLRKAWQRAAAALAFIIAFVIFSPIPLFSQSSASASNLPLVLATGEQSAPVLVGDGKEGAFVIWRDKRESRVAIYAQHLNHLSQPTWQQDGILVATSAKDQLALAAISDDKNGALIFWQDLRNDVGDIFGQRVDASGNLLWGAAGLQIVQANNKQSDPKVVSDGEGGAFVVYRDFKSGNEDIAVQRIENTGKILFEPAGRIVAQGLGNQTLGGVTATADGGFVAVWSDNSAGLSRVAAQRFDAKANPQWATTFLVTASIRSTQTSPVVYVGANDTDAHGNTFVVWSDNRNRNFDLFAQKIDAAGLPQWGLLGVTICKASNDQDNPRLVSDGSDGVIVAWEDQRSGKTDIYAQAVNAAGQMRWQSDGVGIVVATQEQTQPQIIPDGSSGLICVWTDERNSGTNIAAQRLDKNDKALWAANGIFITPEGGAKQLPAILAQPGSFLGSNGSFVVWEDSRRGNEDIFFQAFKGDGALANVPPVILSSPVTEAQTGSPYNYQIKALDYDSTDPLSLELATKAAWLQVDKIKLQLFGTPGAGDAGETAVTLIVKDKFGAEAAQNFLLKIILTNRPPQITSKPDTLATEDLSYSYQIVASDPDPGETLTYSLQTDATWLRLTNDHKIAGTPANDHVGSYTVTAKVADKPGVVAEQKFRLHVKNVNDLPFFTSQPDTVAIVDSLYVYRPLAADVDRGDLVQIIKRSAPEWLIWNSSARTLQGKPNALQIGEIYSISLLARDAAGASTEQAFRLRIVTSGPLDVTAPAAPQAAQIQPAQWSANKKFTLQWQNPFDPSRVTGAFYKIGAPPAHNQDGTFVPSLNGVTIVQLELLATKEGATPVYLWLVDGRGNVDFRNAAMVNYRYDAAPPSTPQNLSPNRQWSRGDSLLLQWTPSTDAASGIRRYHFFLDGKFFGFFNGEASGFLLILQLSENSHNWTFMAEDSAGNLSLSAAATFKVDRKPPTLQHQAVDTANAATELVLSAQAQDALSGIREVRLHYRAAGEKVYRSKNLQTTNSLGITSSSFLTRLEAAEVAAKGLEYFIEAADSAGNRGRWPVGAPANFHAVVVASANVAAPGPFIANRYQIFSTPYRLSDDSPAKFLEDDWGSYDPFSWRLFHYQPGAGNVEFGKPDFKNFAPGRAFWLITTQPQNYDAGPVHSVRTDTPFELELQPGWNLIATPFDFLTSWPAAQKPASVENNLWAFDGVKYIDKQESLLPWQGYFVRNLEAQPQTIRILPVAGNGANKSSSRHEEIIWQAQLRVSDGEFSDDTNHLGAAPRAVEAWDPLDLSEPPAIGEHVSLYFARRDWPRFAGDFTSDFRPINEAPQQWSFIVVASRSGLPVKLCWKFSGDLPDDWIFVLHDIDGHRRRQIRPDELNDNYVFRATPQARNFVWWAGKKELLAEAGALQNLVPAEFELAPSYPNPLRLAGAAEVGVIRFGLPEATAAQLTIFDVAGRKVRALVAGENLAAGYHEVRWNGRDDNGRAAAAGIYLYRLETATFSASRKIILLR